MKSELMEANAFNAAWWTAERVSTLINAGLLIVAIVTAFAATSAIRQTREIIRQNEEAQTSTAIRLLKSQERQEKEFKLTKLATERAYRPYMVARYVPPSHPHDDLDLEISNNGQSVAKNVRIAFDPPLPEPNLKMLNENALSSSYMASTLELARAVFVGRRFKTIPPGQSIKAPLWSQNRNFRASNIDAISAEGLPSKQGITISYYDDAGTSYIDTFEIDPLIYAGNLFKDSELTKVRKALESHLKNRH